MIMTMDERIIRIRLLDLGCIGDVVALERHLVHMRGVLGATVNAVTETAYVRYDGFATSSERLRAAIVAEGFRTPDPVAS
jgi:hypothetical protein